MKTLFFFLALAAALPWALGADTEKTLDVSEGFGAAKWGMSVEMVLNAVPGTEQSNPDPEVSGLTFSESLVRKGEGGPVLSTYYLFLEDQLIGVVRFFDREILKQTTQDALQAALAKQLPPVENIEISFQDHILWSSARLTGQSRPGVLARLPPKPRQVNIEPSELKLTVRNLKLILDIGEKMKREQLEKTRIAAEKLAPLLIAP